MTNSSDVNTMILRETSKQRLHAFLTSLVPLGAMSCILIGPADGHVFGSDSIETEVTSISRSREVQRTMVRFAPLTGGTDRVIDGSNAAGECCYDGEEEQARHAP